MAFDPAILCPDEEVYTPAAPAAALEYRDPGLGTALPQRAAMFDRLCAALPERRATFCPAARGDPWHGDASYPSKCGLATLVRCDLAVIVQAQDFAHGDFGAHGYGGHPRSRSAHVVRL